MTVLVCSWKSFYQRDLSVYLTSQDPGEAWFGEAVVDRVCSCICRLDGVTKETSILDVGCGNAHLLISLVKALDLQDAWGSDYIDEALVIAEKYAKDVHYIHSLKFVCDDILATTIDRSFDLVVDKGTFDAIALSGKEEDKVAYRNSINALCTKYFVVTSCNFVKDELVAFFSGTTWQVKQQIPYPVFSFGGATGSTVTSLVFERVV
jgi:EEF1A lysine methyltransferase 2